MSIGAGDLYYRVAFDKKGVGSDGGGGTTTAWSEQFQCRAAYKHLRGGEGIQAARLEGRHMQLVIVRASIASRQVTAEWRLRDARSGDVFAIRDVTVSNDRAWVEILCERGVAE